MQLNISRLFIAAALSAASLALSGLAANAQSIGINFSATTHTLAAADQPGIVPGANWNNIAGGSASNVALNNNSGTASGALLTINGGSPFAGYSVPSTANAATNTLYRGGLGGSNTGAGEVSISLTNIPFAVYDVYVFASQDTTATNTLSVTDSITTFYYRSGGATNAGAASLLQTTSTNVLAPTVGQAQYQLFTGKTGSTFTLTTGGSLTGQISNNVFGVQVVAVPESGSLALVLPALGVLGAMVVRRKK